MSSILTKSARVVTPSLKRAYNSHSDGGGAETLRKAAYLMSGAAIGGATAYHASDGHKGKTVAGAILGAPLGVPILSALCITGAIFWPFTGTQEKSASEAQPALSTDDQKFQKMVKEEVARQLEAQKEGRSK